jgi:hypothetical protein
MITAVDMEREPGQLPRGVAGEESGAWSDVLDGDEVMGGQPCNGNRRPATVTETGILTAVPPHQGDLKIDDLQRGHLAAEWNRTQIGGSVVRQPVSGKTRSRSTDAVQA